MLKVCKLKSEMGENLKNADDDNYWQTGTKNKVGIAENRNCTISFVKKKIYIHPTIVS